MITGKIILLFTALLFCILNAEHDAKKIKKHRKVSHELNAGVYLAIIIFGCFLTDWKMCVPLLFLRPLVFDSWLNKRRGLKFTYQPESPDSFVDRMENKIFGHKRAWAGSNAVYLVGLIVGVLFAV